MIMNYLGDNKVSVTQRGFSVKCEFVMSSGNGHNRYKNKWKHVKRKNKSVDVEENSGQEENPSKKQKKNRYNGKEEMEFRNVMSEGSERVSNVPDKEDKKPRELRNKWKQNNSYIGWDLYFDNEDYDENSNSARKIKIVEKFLTENQELISQTNLTLVGPFNLDINKIYENQHVIDEWPNFKSDLQSNPSHTLSCVGVAVHQTIVNILKSNGSDEDVPLIRMRILNYLPIIPLKELRVNYYGKLITTRGCVMRVSRITQLAQWHVFACRKCHLKTVIKQINGNYTIPKKCDSCGPMKFDPVFESIYESSTPFQKIRLQEHLGDNQDDKQGGTLRVIDVELMDDLVDTCMPGADVVVTGILKGPESELRGRGRKEADPKFNLHLEAVSITSNKSSSRTKRMVMLDLNYHDYVAIREIHNNPNLFGLLVHSMCPNIYGHELIKAGLLLSLFGGSGVNNDIREDIHVLLVGDPGLGKSQMLLACSRLAPRGVYICGSGSTSSGLTVTLIKEPGTNDYILEPGALVLADRGCCVIDEFDKMAGQHQALLEAMEQQCVSVAKSGVIWSLPARTSILAAANPNRGHYNKCKTTRENLNFSQPLLSRFDLVFLLFDNPDKERDTRIIQHVMAMHRHTGNRNETQNIAADYEERRRGKTFKTLKKKLENYMKDNPKTISHIIFRKYIAYARQYVRPRLSEAANKVMQDFYLELRKNQQNTVHLPIYTRQLEALIRLTAARAKIELRESATENDALEVVEIVKQTIIYVPNESAPISNARNFGINGNPTKNKIKAFINLLKQERMTEKQLFTSNELEEIAESGGIAIDDMTEFINQLNEKGFLLKKGANLYKFLST